MREPSHDRRALLDDGRSVSDPGGQRPPVLAPEQHVRGHVPRAVLKQDRIVNQAPDGALGAQRIDQRRIQHLRMWRGGAGVTQYGEIVDDLIGARSGPAIEALV